MSKAITLSLIMIFGLAIGNQDQGVTKILTPEFNATDLSIPKSINFQGYLYRDGNPMDTTMNMWFGIYDGPAAGNLLFQLTINNILVTKGWFTVTLDNVPNSVFPVGGPTRYLEVKAPSTGPSLSPRISLVSVGYSYHAITADSAEYAKATPLSRPITPPIYSTEIRDTTIVTAKIKDGAISSAKILDATIKGVDIAMPCSLQGSVALPNAILNIRNNGTGRGIVIDRVGGHGIYIDSTPSGIGLFINKANGNGVYIDSSTNPGIYVNKSGSSGIQVNDVAKHGFTVNQADSCGLYVKGAVDGVYIDSAGTYGVRVMKANNGFRIDTATTHGVRVLRANEDGIHVWDAGRDGVRVWRSDDNGIFVDSAADCGFSVNRADTGLKVNRANRYGIFVDSAGDNGMIVHRAGNNGVSVYHAGTDGVFIDSAYRGIFIVEADYGIMIDDVFYDGLEVHGDRTGGIFFAGSSAGEALIAHAFNNVSTDTAIYAYGKGIASGGWSTGFDKGKEAPCIVSQERTIISYGTTRLNDGKAEISYPEIFKDNIQNDIPVRISLTPTGNPSGMLCVTNRKADKFEVILKQIPGWSGDKDIAFDWIAIGTLKEPETSADAKAEWEKMTREREERKLEHEKERERD